MQFVKCTMQGENLPGMGGVGWGFLTTFSSAVSDIFASSSILSSSFSFFFFCLGPGTLSNKMINKESTKLIVASNLTNPNGAQVITYLKHS